MNRSVIADGFDHHVWATLRVLGVCARLDPAQLETSVPGTYGSIIDTLRHIVDGDCGYLFALTAGEFDGHDSSGMDVSHLRSQMEANSGAWSALLDSPLDPDVIVVRYREDGSESHAPLGIRLAQALHHGTDHRSQICTALTSIAVGPPDIDVWDMAESQGRLTETPPT